MSKTNIGIEGWHPVPYGQSSNGNVMNEEGMTSPAAQAARARSQEIMAALKKGEPGDADKLMGKQPAHDSVGGMGKWKKFFPGRKGEENGREGEMKGREEEKGVVR